MLLAGYAYAHFSFERLGIRRQPWLHFALLLLAGSWLPFRLAGAGSTGFELEHPALWVFFSLSGAIGIPVFVLAATAPLLQKWFAASSHPSAGDPYFLYAASNIGSFSALVAYPLWVEPYLPLRVQIDFWSAGFWILLALIVTCGWLVARDRSKQAGLEGPEPARPVGTAPLFELKKFTIFKWIGLSFVPSSLMLGVTNYITTDVASVPLLWVIPLGLYLFTFVIAFSKHSAKADKASGRAIPILALAVVFPMVVQATEPVLVLVLLHLLFFLFAALRCHLKLARSRPAVHQLTQFYLAVSVGGVLGGMFNALLAPLLFSSILEYPLMILAGTLIGFPERAARKFKFSIPPVYGGGMILLAMIVGAAAVNLTAERSVVAANTLAGLLLLGCYLLLRRPVRYTLALGALLACSAYFRQYQSQVIERDRNFFGVLRVTDDSQQRLRRFYHGTTIHGVQSTQPERRCHPLSYYHPDGPVGQIAALFERCSLPRNVGLIGLGAGAMITFSQPGQHWTLYEIDPAVVRIARDTNYFTYLSECARAPYQIELGDARLRLRGAPDGHFGLLFLDAFTSDVIPMHLLTIEALRLYRQKLAPEGILAFHLSSRHFELEPLVARFGAAGGLRSFSSTRGELNAKALAEGGLESNWMILVPGTMEPAVLAQGGWHRVTAPPGAPLWTDDFSSLLGVLRLD